MTLFAFQTLVNLISLRCVVSWSPHERGVSKSQWRCWRESSFDKLQNTCENQLPRYRSLWRGGNGSPGVASKPGRLVYLVRPRQASLLFSKHKMEASKEWHLRLPSILQEHVTCTHTHTALQRNDNGSVEPADP